MIKEDRNEKIKLFGEGYTLLIEALKKFPKEMWIFKPSPDNWCIHEIITHLADSEANAYVKCRKLIAEPNKPIADYNQEIWASGLNYMNHDTKNALELFRLLRCTTHDLIKSLSESIWIKSVGHIENSIVTLDDWLDLYSVHVTGHIHQMERRYNEWLKTRNQ